MVQQPVSLSAELTTANRSARPFTVSATTAFWLMAAVLTLFLFAASAPSPLYTVYQAEWHFSPLTLTAIFATYAITLLASLLCAGSISDVVGRRPAVLAGLIIQLTAMAVFVTAHDVGALYAARALQGVATGVITGAASAALVDLQSTKKPLGLLVGSAAPIGGLALGALGSGALVQYAPAPTTLIYWLLIAAFAILTIGIWFAPETARRGGSALRELQPRISVAAQARTQFIAVLPCLIALWALGGLFLSLGPSLAAQLTGSSNHLIGGVTISLLMGGGAVGAIVGNRIAAVRALIGGCSVLTIGMVLTVIAIATASSPLFFIGVLSAGPGFGLAMLSAFRSLIVLARPTERGGLIAAVYVVSYLALSLPTISAGIATIHFGLHATALWYGTTVGFLVALSIVVTLWRQRRSGTR